MGSFKAFLMGEDEVTVTKVDVEDDIDDLELDLDKDDEYESIDDELNDIIKDMTDEEKEILLAHAYALVLVGVGEETESTNKLKPVEETSIEHLTGAERTQGKLLRRTPKWKKKARLRYLKNKNCPPGTSWSSESKSCTRINIDLSRLQKMISSMKIRG